MVVKDEIIKALGATVQQNGYTYATFDSMVDANKSVLVMAEHPIVALEQLQLMKGTVLSGRPFILLLLDIEESFKKSNIEATVNIVIGTVTEPSYSTDARYSNNFTPILYPIYEEAIKRLCNGSKTIHTTSFLEFTKYDRVLWGKQGLYGMTGNIFDDYIDAIEINNLKLLITKSNC